MRTMRNLAVVAAFAAAFAAAAAGRATADTLDDRLINQATSRINAVVKDRHWNNVGVLKFEIQRGGEAGPVTMSAGSLSSDAATRLENALILQTDKVPLGIVRGASAVAVRRDPKAGYHTEAGRRALLALKYPLAWGKDEVSVDGFLTGRIIVSPDWKKATLVLRAFGNDDLKIKEIARIDMPADRALLVDADQPFAASMAQVKKRMLLVDAGGTALPAPNPTPVEDIVFEEQQKTAEAANPKTVAKVDPTLTPVPIPVASNKPDNRIAVQLPPPTNPRVKEELDRVLQFKVLYDGVAAPWTADNRLMTPKAGQKVEIHVRSSSGSACVLRINGVNTADDDNDNRPLGDYAKWVLEKDQPYVIAGFYTNDDKVKPFVAQRPDDVDLSELGDERRIGKIDLDVFLVPPAGNVPPANGKQPPAVSLRGLVTADTMAELRGKLKTLTNRNLIVGAQAQNPNGKIPTTSFTGVHAIHFPIVYFDARAQTPTFLQPEIE